MAKVIMPAKKIHGSVVVSGAKNSALLLLAASVLATDIVVFKNVPRIADVDKMCAILRALNIKTSWLEDTVLQIDPRGIVYADLDLDVCGEIRTSILFMGALLGRFGRIGLRLPGGCSLGPRPINFHIKAMRAMGATVVESGVRLEGVLQGSQDSEICFEKNTVTGLVNTLLCAATRHATTVIKRCAIEPEIDDCILFLNKIGARIERKGADIVVQKGDMSGGAQHSVLPDRIEAGTFLILTAAVGGVIVLKSVDPSHMTVLLDKLKEVGAGIKVGSHSIALVMKKRPIACDIDAMPYPGFPTDLQPQWGVLAAVSKGVSTITDHVYPARFDHMVALEKMGAIYREFEGMVQVEGVLSLKGCDVYAKNLRSAAALVIAAKLAKGSSNIHDIEHLYRGYQFFFEKIEQLETVSIPV